MNIDLDLIHKKSLSKVLFYTDDSVLENLDSMFNFLFTRNGVFLIQNTNFGMTFRKIPSVPYTNLDLLEFSNQDSGVKSYIPKAGKEHLELILEGFKYVQNKVKNEIFMILYWDTQSKDFILRIPETQIISSGNDKYDYPDEEHDDRFIRYLEVHSHHSMGAKFSGGNGDDKDEANKPTCFYGVVGNLNKNTTIHNLSGSFRVWNGYDFTYVNVSDVFNVPKPKTKQAPTWMTNILDQIIERSKSQNKGITYYQNVGREFNIPEPNNPYTKTKQLIDEETGEIFYIDKDGDLIEIEDDFDVITEGAKGDFFRNSDGFLYFRG